MGAKVREKAAGDRTRRPGTKPWNTGKKGRAFRGAAREKSSKKILCPLRTADKRQAGPGGAAQAGRKSAAGGVWAGKQRRRRRTRLQQASRTAARTAAGNTRRDTDHTSRRKSGRPRKNGQPGTWRGTPDKKNPSEQAKFAFALLPARWGHVNRGRQKNRFAVFGWHGFWLRIAHNAARSAEQKGAPPPFIPAEPFGKGWRKL